MESLEIIKIKTKQALAKLSKAQRKYGETFGNITVGIGFFSGALLMIATPLTFFAAHNIGLGIMFSGFLYNIFSKVYKTLSTKGEIDYDVLKGNSLIKCVDYNNKIVDIPAIKFYELVESGKLNEQYKEIIKHNVDFALASLKDDVVKFTTKGVDLEEASRIQGEPDIEKINRILFRETDSLNVAYSVMNKEIKKEYSLESGVNEIINYVKNLSKNIYNNMNKNEVEVLVGSKQYHFWMLAKKGDAINLKNLYDQNKDTINPDDIILRFYKSNTYYKYSDFKKYYSDETALGLAAQNNHRDAVKYLITISSSETKINALFPVVKNGNIEIFKDILESIPNNHLNSNSYKNIVEAVVINNQKDMLKILLDMNIKIDWDNVIVSKHYSVDEQENVFEYAKSNGLKEIEDILQKKLKPEDTPKNLLEKLSEMREQSDMGLVKKMEI